MQTIKRAIFLIAIACYLLQGTDALAQSNSCNKQVFISVTEAATGHPIVAAMVATAESSAFANELGWVKLEALCSDSIHIHVQADGFALKEADFRFQNGDTILVSLYPSAISLDDIEISGHRTLLATPNATHTLQSADLEKAMGGSLAASLTSIPGVSVLQTGATIGKPVVNGMHSNRLLILNNGVRQEGQQWGAEHAPEIDPFIAQTITVVKGAEAIRYGAEAIGGVVIVKPAPLPRDSALHATVHLVGASNGRSAAASAQLGGHFKQLPAISWRVQSTAKRGGNYQTAQYYLSNSGVKEFNYSAAIGYTKEHFNAEIFYSHFNSQTGIFKGSHIGSTDDLNAAIAHGRPFNNGSFSYQMEAPRQKVIHDLWKINAHWHWSDYAHADIQYGLQHNQREEYDIRRGGRSDLPASAFKLFTHTLDAALKLTNGSDKHLTVGINGLLQQNKKIDGTGTQPLIPNFNAQGVGLFAIAKQTNEKYELEGGLRYDFKYLAAAGYRNNDYYSGRFHFHNVSASLGGVYFPTKGLDIRTNIATAWRPPTVNELFSNGLHHGVGAIEIGDSSLKPERSLKWITSVHFNRLAWLDLSIDGYIHYFDNYIYLQPTGGVEERLRGAFPIFQNIQTAARFVGLDAQATIQVAKGLDYTLKGAFVQASNLSDDSFLPMIPAGQGAQTVKLHQQKLLFFEHPFAEFTHVFVGKQNRYNEGDDFAPPPDAYHLLNAAIGARIPIGSAALKWSIACNNIANVLYKDYLNRFRYYAHDIGRNFVVRLTYAL